MTSLPPSGSRSVPSRARKSSGSSSGGFGSAIRQGVQNVSESPTEEPKKKRQPQVRIARQTYNSLMAKKILKASLLLLLGLVVLYVCFAATILRFIPSISMGPVLTKNITFPGGLIPEGESVVIDVYSPRDDSMEEYLKQAFVPQDTYAIMKVEGGPWGGFTWDKSGVVTYEEKVLSMKIPEAVDEEGNPLGYPNVPSGGTALENEYLMTCLAGACNPGQGYVFSAQHIVGQPLGG